MNTGPNFERLIIQFAGIIMEVNRGNESVRALTTDHQNAMA